MWDPSVPAPTAAELDCGSSLDYIAAGHKFRCTCLLCRARRKLVPPAVGVLVSSQRATYRPRTEYACATRIDDRKAPRALWENTRKSQKARQIIVHTNIHTAASTNNNKQDGLDDLGRWLWRRFGYARSTHRATHTQHFACKKKGPQLLRMKTGCRARDRRPEISVLGSLTLVLHVALL